MIKVSILKSKANIEKIQVTGHAGYADRGEDILCASISVLIFTLIEAMDAIVKLDKDKYSYQIDPKAPLMGLEIKYDKLRQDELIQVKALTGAFELGCRKSAEAYEDFIKIKIQEV